ncbi:flagellar protein MotX [Enterovibrio nigricans]|uniref:Sel1 repeat-containing protein n=1 Tax=Enterovibrio nigricans DSM 22720 TaxID=1121868 RepID=A0A1T4UTD6_9GAMM|nr:tetratricopeptide repeat protein [Enterovibrio nigricans]PKF49790.1 sel1 repeat family protein [Enterovibrio nigricans]SKA55865.1 Sel1 repeat-containing protein [Enterovibrio nigricans DSM 22720]
MKLRTLFLSIILASGSVRAELGPALPVYDDSQLIRLFETNSHLKKIKQDECQLLQDIEARALRVESPAYQFLYGDMLAWGVCVDRDVENGIYYMQLAAQQGLPAALEQLGRYYSRGTLVQQDRERAIPYFREAASLGDTRARLQLAELLVEDYGSPLDYEDAYRWLYHTITADQSTHNQISSLRKALENKMPRNVIARAKRRDTYW